MQCFSSTYNIASTSAFYPSRLQKKSAKPSAFYTFENPQIRKSAFYRRPKKEARSTKGLEWRFWVRNGAVHRMGELSWMVLTSGGYTVFNSLLSLY